VKERLPPPHPRNCVESEVAERGEGDEPPVCPAARIKEADGVEAAGEGNAEPDRGLGV
jgi:hypothetical protein